jgi:heavy metal sensor kinase
VLAFTLIGASATVYLLFERDQYHRIDDGLRATTVAIAGELERRSFGPETEPQTLRAVLRARPDPHQAVAIFDSSGRLLSEQPTEHDVHVRLPSRGISSVSSPSFYSLPERVPNSDDSCRGIARRVQLGLSGDPHTLVVNQSLELVEDKLDLLLSVFCIAVPAVLVLATLAGWWLVSRSLAPVTAMSDQAQRISVKDLNERLPVLNPRDELGLLAASFNALLARLASAFSNQRRFMADASHELRTPLSAIRMACEVTLQREERETTEYRDALTIVERQSLRLTRIVEDLFVLARADAEGLTLRVSEFYLDELLTEIARDAAMLAARKGLLLEPNLFPEALFRGDETLLSQMIWNVIDNAIKYTPRGGRIGFALEAHDAEYVITVTDTGLGIPMDSQPHIFERFYRADQARTRVEPGETGGAGLGLPIARWIAEAHHGRLQLRSSDRSGSVFAIYLPHNGGRPSLRGAAKVSRRPSLPS